jgi:hypothetical protein
MPQKKSATSLMVANLLVIVSFVYRYFRDSRADLDQPAEFTSVNLSQFPTSRGTANTTTGATVSIQKRSVFEADGKSPHLSSDTLSH